MAADSIVAPPPWRAIMQRPLPPCFRVPVERFRGKGSAACAQRSGQIESMNNGVLPPGGALVGIHPPVDGVAAGVAGGTGSPGPGRPSIPRRRPVGFARWLHRGRAETHRFHLRVVLDQRLHPEGVHSAVEDSPASVVAVVHAGGDGELAEIAGTLDLFRPRLGARQSRQKQCRQDGGDGDDHGKFNQGKPVARSRSRRAAPSEGRD
jgi:hypothetical protein